MAVVNSGLSITLGFGGGAELSLVDNKKNHKICLPNEGNEWTIKKLFGWMKDNVLKDNQDLFLQNSVRPGVLVLINDADWELLGQGEYKLCPNDSIHFISTLHGG